MAKDRGKHMASQHEIKAHEETYSGFIGFIKWGTIATAVAAVLVIILIT